MCNRLMVTRFDSVSFRGGSAEKESSDSDTGNYWEEPPVCQRLGVMAAFESFEVMSQ